jgi:hypothetical protein
MSLCCRNQNTLCKNIIRDTTCVKIWSTLACNYLPIQIGSNHLERHCMSMAINYNLIPKQNYYSNKIDISDYNSQK